MTKFFDCGPATFSDQAVEVHAYEAASPFTSPVPSASGTVGRSGSLTLAEGACRFGAANGCKAYRYLTGRGDVPSLNALIKSATYRRSEKDIVIFGLRRGLEALTHLS